MAKWFCKIGFFNSVETKPGVWKNNIIEKSYYAEVKRNVVKFTSSSDKVLDDVNISNTISIIADPYATENFQHLKYVEYMGTKWKVISVSVEYPRLVLTLGGIYNEQN